MIKGNVRASRQLEKAIDKRDPERIRQAVRAGASLEKLPESGSPLMSALFRCDQPNGRPWAELLIELGCPINGLPGDNPPIVNATQHFM